MNEPRAMMAVQASGQTTLDAHPAVRQLISLLAVLCIVAALCGLAGAQNYLTSIGQTSFTAPEPAELGFVETANGNLHLEIPLGSFRQRGSSQPLEVKLTYDSNMWQTYINAFGSAQWAPSIKGSGWVVTPSLHSFGVGWGGDYCNNTDFNWTDPHGALHYFPIHTTSGFVGCPNNMPSGDAMATDSSGYHMYITNSASHKVYASDGTLVDQFPYVQTGGNFHINVTDSNGNYLQEDATGATFADTLGRTIVLNGGSGATILNSQVVGTSNYAITYAAVTVKSNFGQSGVVECTQICGVTGIRSVTLPNNSGTYTFTYDCDQANGPQCGSPSGQSAYYGTLISMTLPTGGVINYTYTTVTDAYGNKARWLNTRWSGSSLWTYTMNVLSTCSSTQVGCQQNMIVVKPNGDTTVNTFTLNNGAWPVQIQQFKGSNTSGTLVSTTNNTFDFTTGCVITGCHGAAYIRKTSETVTVPIPGGTSITKKTTYSYDSPQNANITATKEWKFYPGTSPTYPTIPDRASFVTYYSAGNNIISKPLTTTLCNNSGSDTDCPGGGSKIAQTKVTYDSYGSGMTLVTGAAGHDDADFGTGYTARGNPTQIQQWVTGTTYLTTTYQYDTTGQVLKITDPASNNTTYGYADNFFKDNGSNPPQTYSAPQLTNAYLTNVQLPPVGGVTMTESMGYYFGTGKLATATDPNGAKTYHHFMDPLDRATQTNFPVGGSVTTYPSAAEADAYMPVGDTLPSSSCTSCRQSQFLYDSFGRKATQSLANAPGGAIKSDTTYDANGRVLTVSHPYVNSSDPSHVLETVSYDALNRKTSVTHPDGQASLMAYGANTSTLGGITTQQSSTATYGYGYPAISVDETGKQSQHWVDGFGNVIEADEPSTNTSVPGSGSVTINFNSSLVSMIIDPCQPHTSCPTTIYNSGTLSVTINGCTATTGWGPPPPTGPYSTQSIASALAGQFSASSCLVGATANGSAVTITALAGGSTTNFSFTTSSTYYSLYFSGPAFYPSPASGALSGGSGGISSSPAVTAYTYDVAGRLKQVVQGVQTRTFAYDGLGRPTSIATPEAGTDTLTYDSNSSCPTPNNFPGHLISKVDARGIRTCFQYDTLGRVTQKNYSNGQGSVTYQYDQGGAAAFALGRLTKMTDPSGSETYTYDTQGAGRITQIQKVIGSTTYTTGYVYNTAGQITQTTYPSGRSVTQTVDNIGRLSSVADTKSGTNTTRGSGYSYNNAQQVLNFTYGNGVLATFGYSSSTRDQMTTLSYAKGAQTLFSLNYYYQNDPANCTTGTAGNDGEINCINDSTDSGSAGRTVAYTYDALGRALTAVTNGSTAYAKWGLSWAYDRYGNRLSQTVTAGSGYSNTLGFANPGGAQTNHPDGMCFDNSGNMTAESGTCPPASPMYSYDAENRMTAYSGSSAASYVYDDNGNRVKKCLPNCTSPTTTTVYVFSAGQDVAEYDNGAAPASPSREYIYSGGQLITTLAGSTTTYHHADHLSVRVSTDVNGNKVGEQGHYPYGESWYSNSTTTKFVFTGYQRDSESGNDYAMARYYRVGFGRFCSPDPLSGSPGDPQSWNRYIYARDNPINNVDPSGMSWLSSFIHALVSFFTDVNFGPGGTAPTFPTGNYDVWQKLEDAITPNAGPWIIMNAMPGSEDESVGLASMMANVNSNLDALANESLASAPCLSDFSALGTTLAAVKKGIANVNVHNGSDGGAKFSTLYQNSRFSAPAALADQSIADIFSGHPTFKALAQLNGNNVYVNPTVFDNSSQAENEATLLHEVAVHNVGGLGDSRSNPDDRSDAQDRLGLPQGYSHNITEKLKADCLGGK